MDPIQQPTPEPITTPAPQATPTVVTQPQVQPTRTSKGLAIASLVLGIVSVVIAIVWFVSIPIAITAIVLGIVSLVKKNAGKGMSITGLVTGSVTLFIIIPLILVTVLAYNGIRERTYQYERETRQDQIESLFN